MSKLTKISCYFGAVMLIFWDVCAIWDCLALDGIYAVESIINNMIPCGLLLGILAIYTAYNEIGKKALSVTTLIIFAIVAFIRFITVILYVLERIYVTNLPPLILADYLDFGKFVAFGILAVAVVFLMLYLTKGKYYKTSLSLCGTAISILFVAWMFNVYTLVSEAVNVSSGFFEVFIAFFKENLAKDVLVIFAYLAIFGALTAIIKNKEKAK